MTVLNMKDTEKETKMWRTMLKVLDITDSEVVISIVGKGDDHKMTIPITKFPLEKIVTEQYCFAKINLEEEDDEKLVFDFDL